MLLCCYVVMLLYCYGVGWAEGFNDHRAWNHRQDRNELKPSRSAAQPALSQRHCMHMVQTTKRINN